MIRTIQTRDIMASLPLVASALGNKYGVNVIIGGDQACTNGKTIMLPTLPLDCDAELLTLARAFIDHESAHIRHTDFRALQNANLTPMQKHLWNCVEDWRCENALAAIYPGCRQHFRWLIQHHFDKENDDGAGETNPALSVLNYVLLTVRAWDVPAIEKPKQKEAAIVQQAYPGLLSKLDKVLDRGRMGCKSTQDAISYALELSAIIEEHAKQKEVPKTEKENAPNTNNNPGSGEHDDQPDNASTDSASQSEEPASTDSQADSKRTLRTPRTAAQKQLQEMLHAAEAELPQHLGQLIAEALNAGQATPHQQGLAVARTGYKHTSFLPEEVREESIKNSVALRTRLHGLLQAITRQPGVAVHNPRVFLKRGEKRQTSTAVHLLLDCSGSMSGAHMELASRKFRGLQRNL